MSRTVLAFVPQHTSTKSRVMAIVDKGRGYEIDAVTTVDWPHEAVALCNILNSGQGEESFSGLWHALPASARASLEQASEARADEDDERADLAPFFIATLPELDLPDPEADTSWAALIPVADCPPGGCEVCVGCPAHAEARGEDSALNQCGPGGSCSCVSRDPDDDDDVCSCSFMTVGPRWAAAIYKSLAEIADVLVDHANGLMWGNQGSAVGFPKSLIAQPPGFFMRLAETCADLCRRMTDGRIPLPRTIAELIMIDEAAAAYLEGHVGRDGLDEESMRQEFSHLPEAFGDFDMDALWMLQIAQDDWLKIAESEEVLDPYSVDHIFDEHAEAASLPRE